NEPAEAEPIELGSVDIAEPGEAPAPEYEPIRISDLKPKEPDRPGYDLSFLDSLDLPLPFIESERLEHVDDDWLDNAYEQKLVASGDDLQPVPHAADLIGTAIKKRTLGPETVA